MNDPALRLAVLGEMSSIRFQLIELQATGSLHTEVCRYVTRLQERLTRLEQELREYERVIAIRVIVRRARSRSR